MKKLTGRIFDYFETGCEGVMWVFVEEKYVGRPTRNGMHFIEERDHLTVFDEKGNILFQGIIDPDEQIGWKEYPFNPGHGQSAALGYWIHWTQKGWAPDDWARLFIRPDGEEPLRAILIKHNPKPE